MDKVVVTKSKLDILAQHINEKAGTTGAKTIAQMQATVDGITVGGGAPSLQSKSVTYTSNGTATITPDDGYDGLSSVAVTVNVASGGGVETCTVTFRSNMPDAAGHSYHKIFLTVFENNEITTKTVSSVNNIIVFNVVLNSVGMAIYTSDPNRTSTINATALNGTRARTQGFIFTGNATIDSTFTGSGGGGGD